ncbi:hypothetical protein [Celeribacter persicus]|uniref:Uncharacterized protein n=1 Tax=Celeribacter persicus TaxID=1651082 RepID=A0A2T5HSQ1_9RHOB|nr:hypothetical protein [Celeribacter persicus]PTQ74594.1 hypothetical protein C8N42_104239 [Celeribacter persicus]
MKHILFLAAATTLSASASIPTLVFDGMFVTGAFAALDVFSASLVSLASVWPGPIRVFLRSSAVHASDRQNSYRVVRLCLTARLPCLYFGMTK